MAKSQDKRKEEKKSPKDQPQAEVQAAPEVKGKKSEKKGGGSTVIASHTSHGCKNQWQDARYGKGNRVFNPSSMGLRCTVCHRGRDGQGVGRLSIRRQLIRDTNGGFYKP